MNEQLIVKNFGPIKDATVDFKRVTVFIGPTGGGKSTLAKLAAIMKNEFISNKKNKISSLLKNYGIDNYRENDYLVKLSAKQDRFVEIMSDIVSFDINTTKALDSYDIAGVTIERINSISDIQNILDALPSNDPSYTSNKIQSIIRAHYKPMYLKELLGFPDNTYYIPTERILISTLNNSWPTLISAKADFPKPLLDFADIYIKSGRNIRDLQIEFLNINYEHINERNYINFTTTHGERAISISETASGIQAAVPLFVSIKYLIQYVKGKQSFIIEEPELNLYPTAQQGLLNWLVEKCTKGENDLTITTHSPYILSHLNLLLYAYQVAEQHPERADEVAELVPRESWINPKEFACYQVENGGVTSLVNEDLGLIDDNGLDGLSGDAADAFDNLIRLSKGVALK